MRDFLIGCKNIHSPKIKVMIIDAYLRDGKHGLSWQVILSNNRFNHRHYNQKRLRRIMQLLGIKSIFRKE